MLSGLDANHRLEELAFRPIAPRPVPHHAWSGGGRRIT